MFDNLVLRKIVDKYIVINICNNELYEIDKQYALVLEFIKTKETNIDFYTFCNNNNFSPSEFEIIKKDLETIC